MNHAEKTGYHEETDKFIRNHQVRELLQNALAELVLKRPDMPLDYLIKYFGTKKHSQLYSVVGFPESARQYVINDLLDRFRYERLELMTFEENNDFNRVLKDLENQQENGTSLVLDNFPSTKVC